MDKAEVPPSEAYRLVNPGCVTLVSVGDGERDNLFAVTWNMPVRKDPGMVAIVSGKAHHSYRFIASTGELALNVPDLAIADAVLGCGKTSGRDVPDKFERFGLTRERAARIRPPLVAEAVASLECRVCQVVDLGSSSLLVAQVLRAVASTEHYGPEGWTFAHGLRLIHHLGGADFAVSERAVTIDLGAAV